MTRISLLVNEIDDRVIKENFKRILLYLQNGIIPEVPFYTTTNLPTKKVSYGELAFDITANQLKIYTTDGWVSLSGGGGGGSVDYVRDKFSVRFSENIDVATVEEALDAIFKFTSVSCTTVLSLSPSTTREKGDTLASIDLIATNTVGSNPTGTFVSLIFKRGVATIDTDLLPGATSNYTDVVAITDTTSYSAVLLDSEGRSSTSTQTISFIYPILYLVGAVGLTPAQIYAGATKVLSSTKGRSLSFTTVAQTSYYCFPAALGALTTILDENGFDVTIDWTLRVENLTGLDGIAQSYNIYEFNNLTSTTQEYTFA